MPLGMKLTMVRSVFIAQIRNHQNMIHIVLLIFLFANSVTEAAIFRNFTIFSILKSMPNADPLENQIQINSIWSWSQLVSTENIILFFDDEKSCSFVRTLYQNISCHMFPSTECFHSTYNRPYVSCAFHLAQQYSQTSVLAFVNSDIMLHSSVLHTILFVSTYVHEFFLVGCRRDYEMFRSFNYTDPEETLKDGLNNSRMHATTGIDLISFKVGTLPRIPPFLAGVYRWDNWLLSEILLRTNITVIDATQSTFIIHQQPKLDEGKKFVPHSSRAGAVYNDQLTKKVSGFDYKVGFIHNAHQILSGDCQKNQCIFGENLHRSEIILLKQRANTQKYIAILTVTIEYMPMAWNWVSSARSL